MAPGYARVVHAATMACERGGTPDQVLDTAYVAACTNLVCLRDPYCGSAILSRRILTEADTAMGAWERAWTGMVNLPDPDLRCAMISGMIRKRVKLGEYHQAIELAEKFPVKPPPLTALRWIAEAQTAVGSKSMPQLKQWALEQAMPSHRAAALAGIGAGLKARSRKDGTRDDASKEEALSSLGADLPLAELQEWIRRGDREALGLAVGRLQKDPSDQGLRDTIDSSKTAVRRWSIHRAEALAAEENEPDIQAFVWLEIARVHGTSGDQAAYGRAVQGVNAAVLALWDRIAAGRPAPRSGIDGIPRWDEDPRFRKTEVAIMTSVMDALFQLEALQYAADDKQGLGNHALGGKIVRLLPERLRICRAHRTEFPG